MTVELLGGGKASDDHIKLLEHALGKKLPSAYIDFVSTYDGAKPTSHYIEAEGFEPEEIDVVQFIPVADIKRR